METPTDPTALLTLLRAGLPAAALRLLLDQCSDPGRALAAGPGFWRAVGAGEAAIAALRRPDRAALDRDLAWLAQPNRHLIGWSDPDYPALLKTSPRPPPALYVHGDPTALWQAQVAVVGSRNPSAGGRSHAARFAAAFVAQGLVVTSGLAEGIDAAAHAGALDGGRTIAVVGTGPDIAYPPKHGELMATIAAVGAVVSEHPPGTTALPSHFPSRNRLIAGLSLGTLVVEAALRSGALITARLAVEAGREVFALPGSIANPLARGCHHLIRQGAALAETPEEVMLGLAPVALAQADMLRERLAAEAPPAPGVPARPPPGPAAGEPGQAALWRALGHEPAAMDVLARRTGLTVAALSAMLLAMELEGSVVAAHGRYSRRT